MRQFGHASRSLCPRPPSPHTLTPRLRLGALQLISAHSPHRALLGTCTIGAGKCAPITFQLRLFSPHMCTRRAAMPCKSQRPCKLRTPTPSKSPD
eukprot:358599-Chlamydomonas_euryale.AAC.2